MCVDCRLILRFNVRLYSVFLVRVRYVYARELVVNGGAGLNTGTGACGGTWGLFVA